MIELLILAFIGIVVVFVVVFLVTFFGFAMVHLLKRKK